MNVDVSASVSSLLSVFRELLDRLDSQIGFRSQPALSAGALAALLFAWKAYKAFNRVRVKSLVRGLPGPENPSWLEGAFFYV